MPIFIFIIFDSTQHSYTHFFLVSNINLSYERDWKEDMGIYSNQKGDMGIKTNT